MRMTSKGQVTIPKALREKYGLLPESDIEFEAGEDGVIVRPAGDRASQLKARVDDVSGCATMPVSTDEVMRLTRGSVSGEPERDHAR